MLVNKINHSKLKDNWMPSKLLFSLKEIKYPSKLLGEVAKINPKDRMFKKDDLIEEPKVVKISSIDKKQGKIINAETVNKKDLTQRARLKAYKGDILLPLVQVDKFNPVLVKEDNLIISDNFAVIVPEVNSYYLFWALKQDYVLEQIKVEAHGSTISRISIRKLKELKIPYLNEEKQKEKANLMKEKFSQLSNKEKSLLYKERIDKVLNNFFDINYDNLTNKRCEKVNYQEFIKRNKWTFKPFLAKKINEMIKSKTDIKVYNISQVIKEINSGVSPYRKKNNPKKRKLIKAKNLRNLIITAPFEKKELQDNEKYKLNTGDVLMVRKGRIGPAAVVTMEEEGVLFHDALVRIKVDSNIVYPEYLAIYLNSKLGQYILDSHVSSGTIKYITLSNLKKAKVVIPPLNLQKEIINQVKDLV